jgi:hypothetical protein
VNFDTVRNGAIVVAHPDDETLWCGGLMVRHPGVWTVICCSIPRTDPIRAYKFFLACEALGAKARLLPFEESAPNARCPAIDHLDLSDFDCVVTHNALGEYGHAHHRALHHHIAQRWPDKMVTIGYGDAPGSVRIALSGEEMGRKVAALSCYDHTSSSDGKPKWRALLDRYGTMFDLSFETYERHRA